MAIQAPLIPKKLGKVRSANTVNTRVLLEEIIAEILPFDRAVKKPELVIFSPLNKKFIANSLNPKSAKAKVLASFVKTFTKGVDKTIDRTVRTIEEIATNRKETL